MNFISRQNAEKMGIETRVARNSGKLGLSVEFPQKTLVRGTPKIQCRDPILVIWGGFAGENENGQS